MRNIGITAICMLFVGCIDTTPPDRFRTTGVVSNTTGPLLTEPEDDICADEDALRTATLRTLNQYGFGNTRPTAQAFVALEAWVQTLPAGCVRELYQQWLDYSSGLRSREVRDVRNDLAAKALMAKLPVPPVALRKEWP